MPNTKAAKKALRVSTRRRKVNLSRKWKLKNALKDLRKVLASNPDNYQTSLSNAFSALDKAVKSNILHPNTASRKKSRLAKAIAKSQNQGQ